VRIRDFQIREVMPAPEFPPRTLAADPHGGIWIGTPDGQIVLFRNGAVEAKFPLNPGGYPVTYQIIPQADGSLLASSEGGLVGWRQGKVQRMTTKNGLLCNQVITFIEDKAKSWWLYTRCGLVQLADSELQRWWVNPDAVLQTRVYDQFDGAQPNLGSFSLAATTPDGRLWFANGLVVQVIDPSRLPKAATAAATRIESVIVDRKSLAPTNNLKLPPRPRDLQIDYTSPTFLIPQQVTFRYRLEGYDHDWHDAGTRRQAFYTDLPPGNYSFRVVAANSDGVWNDNPAKLDFSVAPAFYQTPWFWAICAVFLLSLLGAIYDWRVRQLRHDFELTLNARVGERTRIARDLHDTLLQSFHGLLLRLQTVSQLLRERPAEAQEKLDSTIEQAAAAITEGRDAVQGLRDSTVQANDLARAIRTLGEELTSDPADRRPAFHVAVEGQSRDLHPIVRDEIYRIAAEALRNAFLHAKAKQVEAEIRYDDEQFRLRVRDDGTGMSSELLARQAKQGHYGLSGMRERASLIGGKLTIWSEEGSGTEVELHIPAQIAYVSAQRGSWISRKFAAKAKA
jgi:signal transduction histidine kinase